MTSPALRPVPPLHPLRDRGRLEDLKNLMWDIIQKELSGRKSDQAERVLRGGDSMGDILQQSVVGLLQYKPRDGQTLEEVNWEGLAVQIARSRVVDALRRNTRHRNAAAEDTHLRTEEDHKPTIGSGAPTPIESVPDPAVQDDEDIVDAIRTRDLARRIHDAAQTLLDERSLEIFQRVSAGDETQAAIGVDLELTGQRVGQIYKKSIQTIHDALKADPAFRRALGDQDKEGELK